MTGSPGASLTPNSFRSFSGKISRTKGVDFLLRSNRMVQRKRQILALIAGTGRLEEEFDQDERASFHQENLFFIGHQTRLVVAQLQSLAALSVIPSRSEGLGPAALEAMGRGTPVVATRCGEPETFVVGATVPVDGPEAPANGILDLLELDSAAARDLREEALKRARQYRWGRMVERRLDYCWKTLKSKN